MAVIKKLPAQKAYNYGELFNGNAHELSWPNDFRVAASNAAQQIKKCAMRRGIKATVFSRDGKVYVQAMK